MAEERALPPEVVALFQELGATLLDARERLDALLRDTVPVQRHGHPSAEPKATAEPSSGGTS